MDLMDLLNHGVGAVRKRYNKFLGEFYFGDIREHAWEDAVKDLAPILYAKGPVDNPETSAYDGGLRLTYVMVFEIHLNFTK